MDVSAPPGGAVSAGDQMDIDMEYDFSVDPAYDVTFEEPQETTTSAAGFGGALSPGEVAFEAHQDTTTPATGFDVLAIALHDADSPPFSASPAHEKVHIRGLDAMSNDDVKAFAAKHYPTDQFIKVEWINDTSANLIYKTPEAAFEALCALTAEQDAPASDIPLFTVRPAKKLSTHPLTDLFIRQAITSDVKQKGAYDASRYYLLNPDRDPREQRRKQREVSGPLGPRRGSYDEGDYTRNRYDDREDRLRRKNAEFTNSMYDEAGDTDTGERAGLRVRTPSPREELFASIV